MRYLHPEDKLVLCFLAGLLIGVADRFFPFLRFVAGIYCGVALTALAVFLMYLYIAGSTEEELRKDASSRSGIR